MCVCVGGGVLEGLVSSLCLLSGQMTYIPIHAMRTLLLLSYMVMFLISFRSKLFNIIRV